MTPFLSHLFPWKRRNKRPIERVVDYQLLPPSFRKPDDPDRRKRKP